MKTVKLTHSEGVWSEGMFYSYSTLDDYDSTLHAAYSHQHFSQSVLNIFGVMKKEWILSRDQSIKNCCPAVIPSFLSKGSPNVPKSSNFLLDPLRLMLLWYNLKLSRFQISCICWLWVSLFRISAADHIFPQHLRIWLTRIAFIGNLCHRQVTLVL